jgi:hypothetical protein
LALGSCVFYINYLCNQRDPEFVKMEGAGLYSRSIKLPTFTKSQSNEGFFTPRERQRKFQRIL